MIKKQEALSVSKIINEVLVKQLSIPFRQIVNDTAFPQYTGSLRPDLLISDVEYTGSNAVQYVENLLAYAEAKDSCAVGSADWKDAIRQGSIKAEKLGLPYFIVTNCKTTYFYNRLTLHEIALNGNPIREFQTIDIFRLIRSRLRKNPEEENIITNVDTIAAISEAVFNKKMWELKGIYRSINFKSDDTRKIDFTIGFIALEYYEEKQIIDGKKDFSKIYWTECNDANNQKLVANLSMYISDLERDASFSEFKDLMETVKILIAGSNGSRPLVNQENVRYIYDIIDSMRPLHGTGFDLFGAVYEQFASSKQKKEFGEYFTRRHYTQIFSKLLLKDEMYFNPSKTFHILDPACGTGGFLTESFKVLKNNWQKTGTYDQKAEKFLSKHCFYGIDVKEQNISKTKLNMFLVGDGHTNMYTDDTLQPESEKGKEVLQNEYDYILTNPPYGNGTVLADTKNITTKRREIAFLCKVVSLLKIGGKACVIIPDGLLENLTYLGLRKELLEKCNIDAVISLPKFAFAPYTKEKTYALFLTKRSKEKTDYQKNPIWMYIIDNDGLANSDNRFQTKLRNNNNEWKHDEIKGWVTIDGEEQPGFLERRWLTFDDSATNGTTWITEKGEKVHYRKGGNIDMNVICQDKYMTLLPEFYLRPYEPEYISYGELKKKVDELYVQMGLGEQV